MWAEHVFKGEEVTAYDPGQWRQQLNRARTAGVAGLDNEEFEIARSGPGIVAAVCVRDHWQEMSGDEHDWCVDVVRSEVMRQADVWNDFARVQRHNMSADRPCSSVVSLLLDKPLSDLRELRVQHTSQPR